MTKVTKVKSSVEQSYRFDRSYIGLKPCPIPLPIEDEKIYRICKKTGKRIYIKERV